MRILTGLRAVARLAGPVELRFSPRGSPFLRQVARRARTMVPLSGQDSWCSNVWSHRARSCRLFHGRASRTALSRGGLFMETCPGGLQVFYMPISRGRRHAGLVTGNQPLHPSEGGGFGQAYGAVRGLPVSREAWHRMYLALRPLPTERMRRLMEISRDMAEGILSTYRRVGATQAGRPEEAGRSDGARRRPAKAPPPSAPPASGVVGRARAIIRDECTAGPVSRFRLARLLGCAPGTLSRGFRRDTGESIPAFVSRLRVEAARDMLNESAFSTSEIARKTGFGTLRTFHRAFRSQTGMTPMAYRRALGWGGRET